MPRIQSEARRLAGGDGAGAALGVDDDKAADHGRQRRSRGRRPIPRRTCGCASRTAAKRRSPCAGGGWTSSSTAMQERPWSGPRGANPRIDQRIDQVEEEVGGGDGDDEEQDAALDDRKVGLPDRVVDEVAETGIGEDRPR